MSALTHDPSWFIIVGEAAILLTILCGVMVVFAIRQRTRDEHNLRVFIGVVQSDLEARRQNLRELGMQMYRLDGEQLDAMVETVSSLERDIYQTIVVAYNRRDGAALGNFHRGLKKLIMACLQIQAVPDDTALRAAEAECGKLAAELKESMSRNQNLQVALERNQKELSHLMTEYSAAFKKSQEAASAG